MATTTVLVSLGTLILGWFLNWLARQFQIRRDRRAIIGKALSNLLELRHRMLAVDTVIGTLRKQFSVPDEVLPVLRTVFDQLLPQDEGLSKRYEAAIDQLSETDPVTAFEFRSKSLVSDLFTRWRNLILSQGPPIAELELAERQLKELLIPRLNDAVVELARLHGLSTRRQVNTILGRAFEFPAELQPLLDHVRERYPL